MFPYVPHGKSGITKTFDHDDDKSLDWSLTIQ